MPLGAATDVADRWGNTPLDDARRNGDAASIALLQPSKPDAVELEPSGIFPRGTIEALAY